MKRLYLSSLAILIFASVVTRSALAQDLPIEMLPATLPVSQEITDQVALFLDTHRPAETPYYAITYFNYRGLDLLVSVAAINPANIDGWNMMDETNVFWIGSIIFKAGAAPEFYNPNAQTNLISKLAERVKYGVGGGQDIWFPWAGGLRAMYGPRLVHGSGDYGTTGMVAVDFGGGDDLGSNVMTSNIYGSADGTVVYVCQDDHENVIRAENGVTNDKFLYAHLSLGNTYDIGDSFFRGSLIGPLNYGTFCYPDTGAAGCECGWANQAPNHYHVHWMFQPASGYFQAERWTLNTTDKLWHSQGESVGAGGYITAEHESALGESDDGTRNLDGEYVWDGIIAGAYDVSKGLLGAIFPERGALEGGSPLLTSSVSGITIAIRMANILFSGVYGLGMWVMVITAVLFFEGIRWAVAIWRAILKIFPGAN
jgi:hypothetical protein